MKTFTAILIFFAGVYFISAGSAYAAESLRAVKYDVYPNSARVLFEADSDEETTVRIPAAFPPESVRILPEAGNVKILSFKTESTGGNSSVPEFLKNDKKAIDDITAKINSIKSEMAGLELSSMLLDNLNIDGLKAQELEQYIKTASAVRIKTAAEYAVKEKELFLLNQSLKAMTEAYDRRLPRNWNASTAITLKTAGKGKIYFEAATPYAGWAPSYVMALDTASGSISVEMTASVHHATGMVWSGDMEFHSSSPSYGRIPSALPPLIADIYKERPVPATLARSNTAYDMAAVKSAASPEAVLEAGSAAPAFGETLISVNIKTKATLAGDNVPLTVNLKKFVMKSETAFEAIPDYSDKAYITAYSNTPETLLAGNAQLYIDGEYSGTARIAAAESGEKMSVPFGTVKGITVSKKPIIKQTGSSWSKGSTTDGYVIEAFNGLKKEITLKITGRTPISANSKISVDINKMEPKPSKTLNGVCEWLLKLAPGAKSSVTAEYTIKYPGESTLDFRDGMPESLD